ncbi:MAG: cell division protein FtsZ [Dehalococcoidia bacterium]
MAKTSYVPSPAKIKVVGLGGAGCNAVTRMVREQIRGVDFIGINTDIQALAITEAPTRIQVGEKTTRGLGAGGDHIKGRKAAEENREDIRQALTDADMVFIAVGMGGGTGTGTAPVVAELAKQSGALTIAVATRPFTFEGIHRRQVAEEGINDLIDKVDTLIIIPNDRLLDLCDRKSGVDVAFRLADDVLFHGVQAIAEVVTVPGLVNLDFADVRAVMQDAGPAWMSIGRSSDQNRAVEAAKVALTSPLLDVSLAGARGVLFNIVGGESLTLFEVNEAAAVIGKAVDPEANIIFGVRLDPVMDNEVQLTLIATGFAGGGAVAGAAREKELTRLLKGLKTERELDIPTFMRQPQRVPVRREETPVRPTPTAKVAFPKSAFLPKPQTRG